MGHLYVVQVLVAQGFEGTKGGELHTPQTAVLNTKNIAAENHIWQRAVS